jgi:hypothetical protein
VPRGLDKGNFWCLCQIHSETLNNKQARIRAHRITQPTKSCVFPFSIIRTMTVGFGF